MNIGRVLLFVTNGLLGISGKGFDGSIPWPRGNGVVHQVRASLSQERSQDRALMAQDLREGVHGREPKLPQVAF